MKNASILLLAAALAACGRKPPPEAPTPAAVGAELATFPQLLVPISTQAWVSMQEYAAHGGTGSVQVDQFPHPYAHGTMLVGGREASVFFAYTSVWLAPAPIPLRAMSVQQYLRAFGSDEGTDLASVIAPKGAVFFTRDQLLAVVEAARAAGAVSEDMPYSLVRGAAREAKPR